MENSRPPAFGLQPAIFRGTLGNWGIHNVNYGKIAGLTACYFQWISWKLGASIIWVISKQWFYWSYTHKYPKNEIKQSVLIILPLGCAQTDMNCSWKVFSGSRGRQKLASRSLWNFSCPAGTRNFKIGFSKPIFVSLVNLRKFSTHSSYQFSHSLKVK